MEKQDSRLTSHPHVLFRMHLARDYLRMQSLLAIVGSILFWDGVYDLCDEHTWEGTLT